MVNSFTSVNCCDNSVRYIFSEFEFLNVKERDIRP